MKVESKLSFAVALALGLAPGAALAEFPPETGQAYPHGSPGPTWIGAWPNTYTLREAMAACKQEKKAVLEDAASAAPPDGGFNKRTWVNTDCKREIVLPEVTGGKVTVHLEIGTRFDMPPFEDPPNPPIQRYTYWNGSFNGFWPLEDGQEDNGKNLGKSDCANTCIGNPIVVNASNKFQYETDYAGTGGRGLKFHRFYNSAPEAISTSLGVGWRHTYSRSLELHDFAADKKAIIVHRDDGMQILFRESNGLWLPTADVRMQIKPVLEAGVPQIWELSNPVDGSTETYDASGRLVAIDYDDGYQLDLAYTAGRLSQVTDAQGRTLSIVRRADGLISTVTDPGGVTFTYKYSAPVLPAFPELSEYRLDKVTATSGYAREYRYDTGTEPYRNGLLTQILDETGSVRASFSYDTAGNPISTEHTGGAERYTIQSGPGGTTEVVYTNGLKMRYRFTRINGRTLPLDVERICTTSDCSASASYSYDAAGFPDRANDFGGSKDFDYNAKGQLVQRIDAPGTNVARKVQFDWHPQYDVPVEERVYDSNGDLWSKKQWTYNSRGQQRTSTSIDPTTGETRTTTTTYCESLDVQAGTCPVIGLTIGIDGPRTDVSDVTSISYYSQDDAGCSTPTGVCAHRKGDVWKEVNAVGHVTEYLAYDRAGRPASIRGPNGVVTDFEYDLRGNMKRSIIRGVDAASEADDRINVMEFDSTGLLKKITDPDGVYTRFEYDPAGRLKDVVNSVGDKISYSLDNEGRPEKTEVRDVTGTLTRTLSTTRDQLGQVSAVKDAYGRTTAMSYWKNGTPNYTTDPLGGKSVQNTDELSRPSRHILAVNSSDPNGSMYFYDAGDALTSIYDADGKQTVYNRNRFGELQSLVSPTTGTTVYSYNKAGGVVSAQDADGRVSTNTYDALGRKLATQFPSDSGLNISHSYDVAPSVCVVGERFTIGKIVRTTDSGGSMEFCYDRYGRVTRRAQVTNGKTFVTRYVYSKAGRLQSMIYPSGLKVSYGVSSTGDIASVSVTQPGQAAQVLLSGVQHYPYGPAKKLTFGNGRVLNRTFDLNYSPLSIQDAGADGLSLGYKFNEVGNLVELRSGSLTSPPVRKYEYDVLQQLNAVKSSSDAPLKTYVYTPRSFDRKSEVTNGATSVAGIYDPASGRLTEWGGKARTYDASGNTLSIGGTSLEFAYNAAGRMDKVKANGAVAMTYRYSANGERVLRQWPTGLDYTSYDITGRVLGRYGSTGASIFEVVWLGDAPIGIVSGGKLLYVEADHLGTPRVVIDPVRQRAVWSWDITGDVFGANLPSEDPDGDGAAFKFDLRFAGQQYDSVSRTHYNVNRHYDPATGRFLQSDPIGLVGGLNTYNYVSNSPLLWSDPLGLLQWTELPIRELRTLVTGGPMRTFPTDGQNYFKAETDARTALDWKLRTECDCTQGQFSLKEFTITLEPIVYLRPTYASSSMLWENRKAEGQHVSDFRAWFSKAKVDAQNMENGLKASTYPSLVECLAANKMEMLNFLNFGAWQTAQASWRKWDKSGKHTVVK